MVLCLLVCDVSQHKARRHVAGWARLPPLLPSRQGAARWDHIMSSRDSHVHVENVSVAAKMRSRVPGASCNNEWSSACSWDMWPAGGRSPCLPWSPPRCQAPGEHPGHLVLLHLPCILGWIQGPCLDCEEEHASAASLCCG